ncbi:hypothetical protein [Halorubrum aethiopicum]|uniref:hypothetical protein n=1 Tax=Halorubrum aethiopicum TaxID=1758255 RepID=UPI00082E5548|nr:hypothetical protein [Halorubrum aethiopicum]
MTTETDDTTTDESIQPNDGVSLQQRARAEREFQKLRESDNHFAAIAVDLRDQGASVEEIYRQYAAIESDLGDASMAEQTELIPEWEVVVKEADDTPSGYRYERYERTAETQAEAEDMVERHTGLRVVSEKTERIGYVEVA